MHGGRRPAPRDAAARRFREGAERTVQVLPRDKPGGCKEAEKEAPLRSSVRKLAARQWPIFDDRKHRWDEFKARTVNMARRAGHGEDEIAQALHDIPWSTWTG